MTDRKVREAEVTCSCGWFANARGASVADAKHFGARLFDQHVEKAHPGGSVNVKFTLAVGEETA
jgi:hypothetical protein